MANNTPPRLQVWVLPWRREQQRRPPMTLRELTEDITYRALSDVPDGLPLTMRLLRENIARHGLPYVDGGLAFMPERVLLPESHLRAAMVAIVALRREIADRGLPPD